MGSLGAEDGRFSEFGGFVLVRRNGEDGFGGTNLRGVDRVRMRIFFNGMGCKEIIMGCI